MKNSIKYTKKRKAPKGSGGFQILTRRTLLCLVSTLAVTAAGLSFSFSCSAAAVTADTAQATTVVVAAVTTMAADVAADLISDARKPLSERAAAFFVLRKYSAQVIAQYPRNVPSKPSASPLEQAPAEDRAFLRSQTAFRDFSRFRERMWETAFSSQSAKHRRECSPKPHLYP